MEKGTFAVVEAATMDKEPTEAYDPMQPPDLMLPICKEVVMNEDGDIIGKTFYLANVEAFEEPCCCIPDIGGPPNRYYMVEPRSRWPEAFEAFLDDDRMLEDMYTNLEVGEQEDLEEDPETGDEEAKT